MIRRIAAASCILASAALIPLTSTGQASADPGVPQQPTVVFTEAFENGQGATPIQITDYTGPPPISQTYTADPAWLINCNGWIASPLHPAADPPGSNCFGFWPQAKLLAGALGQWAGDPATNHAAIGYTAGSPGLDAIQLEAESAVPLSEAGRFLALSVDAAARGCFAFHPLLKFYLLDGGTEIPAFGTIVDPCANPGAVINGTSVGTYVSNAPVLFTGSSVGFRMRNGQINGDGNDGAVDNIKILDVTPQLDKAFSAASADTNTPVTLTFTITNTADLAMKNGWSFTDSLPAGLTVVNPAAAATTCNGGSASATASSVTVSGNLTAGQVACTATVQVTASHAGTYTNCASNITAVVGLNRPGCASVEFTRPPLVYDAHAHGASAHGLINISPLAPSDLPCATEPDEDTNTLVSATLPAVGTLGLLGTEAAGEVDEDGLRTARSRASTAVVRLLGGLVTADEVVSRATATEALNGGISAGGSVTLTNLRVAGVPVTANPAPNTTINIPLVATVVVNEQTPTAGGRGISVNALHITLLTGTHIVVSHADAALLRPSDPCPPS